MHLAILFFAGMLGASTDLLAGGLSWPIDCIPGKTCSRDLGFPDLDKDGMAFNCDKAGYRGHEGTDIRFRWDQVDQGVAVYAAADGDVLWVFDGKYDRCPAPNPDCESPPGGWFKPGRSNGYRVCTEEGPFCGNGFGNCFWCFDGGNVVVIRHQDVPGVFATRYDHLKKGSISVVPGAPVRKGDKIAEAASAGHSTGPHLHFEVWGPGFYQPVDPWTGPCGTNIRHSLWEREPPWKTRN